MLLKKYWISMHNRKEFIIYPPNYKPGDGFKVRKSKRQAWKVAVKMGVGASVDVCTQSHEAPRTFWKACGSSPLWTVKRKM